MKKSIAIVGAGSSALFMANALDHSKFNVSIYERNLAPARKFLVAGQGGLNITHSEPAEKFITRYTPHAFLQTAFFEFDNVYFQKWLRAMGIATYIGSSGRVFPEPRLKPAQVLDILRRRAEDSDVKFFYQYEWKGFDGESHLVFHHLSHEEKITADYVVFCLGGASWPVTGTRGEWTTYFSEQHMSMVPFEASNCTYTVEWPSNKHPVLEGKPLKNIKLSCGYDSNFGEIVFTASGLEGSGIYPLSPAIRKALQQHGRAELVIDLKPHNTVQDLRNKMTGRQQGENYTAWIRRVLHLDNTAMHVIKLLTEKDEFQDSSQLIPKLKHLPLVISAAGGITDAISTVGGISLEEITANFELRKLPHHFAIGEMLDYDAPTGGYLLQSCFSMAMKLAAHLDHLPKSGKP